ncbi:MAG: UDP-N-acetylmuramoyl-L-alanyl-D-glutamate--2,6-diaminopimelate ligase [Planctomycetota bacterium]|jgi:UDP-N-acetylmuramoyl-L-alanyl-D-glutamate--2,6-diaminopimelate ligase
MRLSALQQRFGGSLIGSSDPEITGVQLDSRSCGSGTLFAALPGTQSDGIRFAADAVVRGAVALLMPHEQVHRATLSTPTEQASQPTLWVHPEARRVVGLVASLLHGEPSNELLVAAITGTNGKTTTAHILGQLLDRAGLAPAVLGTAGHRLAGTGLLPTKHTTPDAPELQALLARHLRAGGKTVAAEMSSHALIQERHAGLRVKAALFTNLSSEHLDYHGDMRAYAFAKSRLFTSLSAHSTAVLHRDDPATPIMAEAAGKAGANVLYYSARQTADLCASRLTTDPQGMRFDIEGMGICSTNLQLPLHGQFNVENALGAALAARLMGASPSRILEGLATTFSAPGRLESVPNDRGIDVLVDYAHSPDALERVLCELRKRLQEQAGKRLPGKTNHSAGRLFCVFGCGGDRDASKRSVMGAHAARLADVVIVTNDNPRGEEPGLIAEQVLSGTGQGPATVHLELDRREAIGMALDQARPGDVVLVAGKGHESGQQMADSLLPFDDRLVAAEALA